MNNYTLIEELYNFKDKSGKNNMGWICPRCNAVHGPKVKNCNCSPRYTPPAVEDLCGLSLVDLNKVKSLVDKLKLSTCGLFKEGESAEKIMEIILDIEDIIKRLHGEKWKPFIIPEFKPKEDINPDLKNPSRLACGILNEFHKMYEISLIEGKRPLTEDEKTDKRICRDTIEYLYRKYHQALCEEDKAPGFKEEDKRLRQEDKIDLIEREIKEVCKPGVWNANQLAEKISKILRDMLSLVTESISK